MTKDSNKDKKLYRLLGFLFILLAFARGVPTLTRYLRYANLPGDFAYSMLQNNLLEFVWVALLFFCGVWIFFRQKQAFFALLLLTIAISSTLALMELVLRSGAFGCENCASAIWIPQEFKDLDMEINRKNQEYASQNEYGFTDENHAVQKEVGKKRVAVLGDSFIWGDGIPYQKSWGQQLKQLIIQEWPDVEVMIWGRNGWSTRAELDFLNQNGFQYKPDFLVVGFTDNDPDVGQVPLKTLIWQDAPILDPVKKIFPRTLSFIEGDRGFHGINGNLS